MTHWYPTHWYGSDTSETPVALTTDDLAADYNLLDDVDDVLTAATIDGATAFTAVSWATSDRQARQVQQAKSSPLACIVYDRKELDQTLTDNEYGALIRCHIRVAVWKNTSLSQKTRIQELQKYVNAAQRAILESPPTNSEDWGGAHSFHHRIEFGSPALDVNQTDPWAVATIPLTIAYRMSLA